LFWGVGFEEKAVFWDGGFPKENMGGGGGLPKLKGGGGFGKKEVGWEGGLQALGGEFGGLEGGDAGWTGSRATVACCR